MSGATLVSLQVLEQIHRYTHFTPSFPFFCLPTISPSTTAIDGKPEVSSAETMETYDEAEKHLDNGDLQLCVRHRCRSLHTVCSARFIPEMVGRRRGTGSKKGKLLDLPPQNTFKSYFQCFCGSSA